ncbi:MAG: hypothetical protein ACRBBR_15255 [Cellvibrionaceae bacterium]
MNNYWVKLLLILLLSISIAACKENIDQNEQVLDTDKETVSLSTFEEFKVSVVNQIQLDQQQAQEKFTSLGKEADQINQKISGIDNEIDLLKESYQKNQAAIEDLSERLTSINYQHGQLAKQVANKLKSSSKPVQKKKKAYPFNPQLLGIMVWGNQFKLSLKHSSDYQFLAVNDAIDQWRLITIDRSENKAIFIHEISQQRITRKIP